MKERIEELTQKARRVIAHAHERETHATLAEEARQPARLHPTLARGIDYTEEGVESRTVGGEPVGVPLDLPAREVSWELRPGRYRVELELDAPGVLAAFTLGEETELMRGRRVIRRAVLDFDRGALRLVASSRIIRLEVRRMDARAESELILGPFRARGLVSARAIGHGDWNVEVASAPVVGGRLLLEGRPELDLTGAVWEGRAPDEDVPQNRRTPLEEGLSWDLARRMGHEEPLRWTSRVEASSVVYDHEEVQLEVPRRPEPGEQWWQGIGRWTRFAPAWAPSFDAEGGLWTYVWGRAEGVDLAYDIETGRRADASAEGAYLVRSYDPESVEIEGAHAAYGEPARRRTLLPGRWARALIRESPPQVYVRARGRGTLRMIEMEERRREGPLGLETFRARRIDLARLWDPEENNPPDAPSQSASALLLPLRLRT